MKVTVEFSLPDEQSEFEDARQGTDLRCAAHDFSEWLRRKLKYEELSDGERKNP